jgi:hypothetical protein
VVKGITPGQALQAQRFVDGAWVPLETANANENDDYQAYLNPGGTVDAVFNITRPSFDLEDNWRIRIVSGSGISADEAIFQSLEDIGSPSLPGTASYANGIYTVKAGGADIWETADQFSFACTQFSGDGEIVARVDSVEEVSSWSKAGIMFRESTNADSREIMLLTRPDRQVYLQWRSETGGTSTSFDLMGDVINAKWLKLVRIGDLFAGYYSIDGESWILVGQTTINMTDDIKAGLAVTSHNDDALCMAEFSHVTVSSRTTNGTPISWLNTYDLVTNGAYNVADQQDADGDGWLNWQEYIAGLNPTNSDTFALTDFSGTVSNNVLGWNAVSGRVYKVYWSSNLVDGFSLIESNLTDGTYIDTDRTDTLEGFYKITVELEP